MKKLTRALLKKVAADFARQLGSTLLPALYGVTDGKAVGTFVEHAFHKRLGGDFDYARGSSASGIDFPGLKVDMKVTSIRQPQSSCPFHEAAQKVYGLGYHLLVFVYDKTDDGASRSARLNFKHVVFVEQDRTADYQTTFGLREILRRNGNKDDLKAFLEERNLPLDEIGRERLAERILSQHPKLGYLTISNALQWRLQYGRVIEVAAGGKESGLENLLEQ